MFNNYFKITWRNIVRQKGNSFINIIGLAIGITCSILILLWVQDELSYDRFHENAKDIYRVVENQYYAGGETFPVAVTPSALAPAMKEQFPEIIQSTRFSFRSLTIKYNESIFTEGVAFADPDIFVIFTIPFIKGDLKTALSEPYSIVLTESAVTKYFGDEEPLGKVLRINNQHNLKVTGVIQNIPDNSHLKYEVLVPFVYLKELGSSLENWGSNWCYTYVLLQKKTPPTEVNQKIKDLIKSHIETTTEIFLQPLTNIHLYSAGKYAVDVGGHGDIIYVKIFSVIAFFVLFIACINFMNLSTARSERRGKEVGLRKVIGAQRRQIVYQFFGESIFMTIISFLLALFLISLLLSDFNDLSGKTLSFKQFDFPILAGFFGIALFSGIVSGSYPALFLSSFKPIEILRGSKGSHTGSPLFRKILIVIQFTLSVILIIGTIVVSKQITYIHNKNLGLDKNNIGYFWMAGEFRKKHDTAKNELLRNPNIESITLTNQLPTYIASSRSGWDWEGKNPEVNVLMHYINVDYDYVKTFKMEMAEGRFYSLDYATDSAAVVVNEKAVEVMGIKSPIGKRLSYNSKNLRIIGVVKDFHFKPIQTKIEPTVLLMMPNRYYAMVMRIKPENINSTIEYVERTYKKFNADTPFYFNFLDEDYNNLYRAEQRTGKISNYFAIIAILISCLGLYGLASYLVEQRTKEIGIRKVLGASTSGIFLLFSKNFIFLAGIANLIAWPIAYFTMNNWLQNYAYHTSLTITIFISASILTITIVILTVSYQAVKAALANPVDSLKYE
jgi:ABC-type antimicrobial peptide transport system permease subunit